jgi:hypothetical protein
MVPDAWRDEIGIGIPSSPVRKPRPVPWNEIRSKYCLLQHGCSEVQRVQQEAVPCRSRNPEKMPGIVVLANSGQHDVGRNKEAFTLIL